MHESLLTASWLLLDTIYHDLRDSEEPFSLNGMPCVVLWRPVALHCRVLMRLGLDLPVIRPVGFEP